MKVCAARPGEEVDRGGRVALKPFRTSFDNPGHKPSLKLAYQKADGGLLTKSILGSGAVFASVAALSGGETSYAALAMEPCEIVSIPFDAVEALMREHLGWERVARKLYSEQAVRKERREFDFLALSAQERWLKLNRESPEIVSRVSQHELAALIGVTPVALSRIKGRLKRG